MFRYLILGLLRNGRRLHGYALVKSYRERSGTSIGSGSFYRELQRLIRDGLIRVLPNPSEQDARRMVYEITPGGAALFDEWYTAQRASVDGFSEDEISARALFLAEAEPTLVKALLDGLTDHLWWWGKQLERDRRRVLSLPAEAVRGGLCVLPLLLARRQKYVAADIELVEALKTEYERWTAAQQPRNGSTGDAKTPPRTKSPRRPSGPSDDAVGRINRLQR